MLVSSPRICTLYLLRNVGGHIDGLAIEKSSLYIMVILILNPDLPPLIPLPMTHKQIFREELLREIIKGLIRSPKSIRSRNTRYTSYLVHILPAVSSWYTQVWKEQ